MKNSRVLSLLLIIQTLAVLVYTIIAFNNEGAGLLGIFVNNIQSLTWNGQFNLDFSCYLMLSGLWIMWRNRFSAVSIIIAVTAMIVGIMVFAPYLLWLVVKKRGDLKKVLVGGD